MRTHTYRTGETAIIIRTRLEIEAAEESDDQKAAKGEYLRAQPATHMHMDMHLHMHARQSIHTHMRSHAYMLPHVHVHMRVPHAGGYKSRRSATGQWVKFKERKAGKRPSKQNYAKDKHFYYNKVSRVVQRPVPPDYVPSKLHIPQDRVNRMNFYHRTGHDL